MYPEMHMLQTLVCLSQIYSYFKTKYMCVAENACSDNYVNYSVT